jgi:NADH:ubiquinone oxidoreductase subunit
VLALANRLRQDGVDAMVDQYDPKPPQGWLHWMTEQIPAADFVLLVCTETYLRRVQHREQQGKGRGVVWEANLIYNLLDREEAKVQRFIPILFNAADSAFIPLPLEGLAHYSVDTKPGYEDLYRHLTNQPRHLKPELGERRSLPPREPQSYPSSPAAKSDSKPRTNLEQRHRQQLLKQVRLDWIEGVLNQSLYKVARLELGLANRTNAVEQPLNAVVQVPDRSPTPISPGTRISQIFDEQAGALLILGAPGTGKTTYLLELAQDLLDRADLDQDQPVPVVFPLSSWAARRGPLAEWLVRELNQRSYVPKKVARQWLEGEQILPLLDGLDEVAAEHREACVDAINQFRREHGLLPIAACSRIADYESLGTKLRLRTAVQVQPLTKRQVKDYLARVGEPLLGLLINETEFRRATLIACC